MTTPSAQEKPTWICGDCGSEDIEHPAVVRWNQDTEDWDVIAVLDDAVCGRCESENLVWGVPAPAAPARAN